MDPVKKIEALEAKRDALEKALAVPERVPGEWLAIRQQVVATTSEIVKVYDHLPPQGTIKMPLVGLEFERSTIGSIEALVTIGSLVGGPVAVFWAWRHARLAWFKWRHARVRFPDDQLATYCQKFELPIASYKENSHLRWQPDAIKSGFYGAYAFFAIAWARMRAQLPQRTATTTHASTCAVDPWDFRHIPGARK